ncbi:MAG TPA: hypothetical protein VF395_08450 [Polyangiaceae bacterium]
MTARLFSFKAGIVAASFASACSGESTTTGLDEPIRVADAQFKEGPLPGFPAPPRGTENPKLVKPTVNGATLPPVANVGEADFAIPGRASSDAFAVGAKLGGFGSGYWLVPVGSADGTNPGDYGFTMKMDFSKDVPSGTQTLTFVAFDANGKPGTQFTNELCIAPAVPDNLNACVATQVPPYLVVSLDWDALVDLDLRVITPAGKTVDAKHPTTAQPNEDGKTDPNAPGEGILRPDSNAGCVIDGLNRENLVFKDKPAPGTYYVYANLFDACGKPSVRFNVSLHKSRVTSNEDPKKYTVDETYRTSSSLLAVHANGGAKNGLFVTEFEVK